MTFRHLEDTLTEDDIPLYLEFGSNLQEPTRTVFGYTLDIASHLYTRNLSNAYTVFGGYAVLSHLMNIFGQDMAKIWRGSSDIDMGGNQAVLGSMKEGYHMLSDSPSPNIPHKRTLKLDINGENECKIDFYLGDATRKYGQSQTNLHFGVPLRVVRPEYIIKGKLKTPIDQFHHYGDILGMLAVLEKSGHSPEKIWRVLDHAEIDELQTRITFSERQFSRDRFGFFPSEDFSKRLKKELHKRRSVK